MDIKTILISGTFRGGTTATANIIKALGVPLGERYGGKLEDTVLRSVFHNQLNVDVLALTNLAKLYTIKYGTFAFKYPVLQRQPYFNACLSAFNNPYFVFVLRDPLAVVRSEKRHEDGNGNEQEVYKRVLDDYESILNVKKEFSRANIKLVSFEYLINPARNKEEIKKLAEWLGIKPSAKKIEGISSALILPDLETGEGYPVF